MTCDPHILGRLLAREWGQRTGTALMLLFGLPLSLLGATVLATMFWLAEWHFYHSGEIPVPWTTLFWVLALITVPLFYITEIRTRGRYFAEAAARNAEHGLSRASIAQHTFTWGPAITVGMIAMNRGSAAIVPVELFLYGPRMVLGAVARMRVARMLRGVSRRRAAEVLAELASKSYGFESTRLLRDGESLDDLIPVLALLASQQWIGARANWGHVWATSESRRVLGTEAAAD